MYFARFLVSVFLITVIISRVDSVEFDCKAGDYPLILCKLQNVTSSTSVIRIKAEDSERNCYEGNHYRYEYHKGVTEDQGWLYVQCGCGGRFMRTEDTAPTWKSWGAWGACSVSCGRGMRLRTRTCSTGDSSDCTTSNEWDNQSIRCNHGSCDKKAETIESVCSKVPSTLGYRIISGQQAQNCEYPWMVMIYNRRAHNFCGGTIIDKNHILTAAHCVKPGDSSTKTSDFVLFSGASLMPFTKNYKCIEGIKIRHVSKIKAHENYDSTYLNNDIAVLTLTEPIEFDKCHVPICLPSVSPSTLSGCKVMGWGRMSSGELANISPDLLYTEVDVVDPSECDGAYVERAFSPERHICAGGNGHGSCRGDSGGPLICPGDDGRYYQYGIVSGGAGSNCGKTAGVYTKVSSYRSWIKTGTGEA